MKNHIKSKIANVLSYISSLRYFGIVKEITGVFFLAVLKLLFALFILLLHLFVFLTALPVLLLISKLDPDFKFFFILKTPNINIQKAKTRCGNLARMHEVRKNA